LTAAWCSFATVFVFGVLNIQWFGGYIEMVRADKV